MDRKPSRRLGGHTDEGNRDRAKLLSRLAQAAETAFAAGSHRRQGYRRSADGRRPVPSFRNNRWDIQRRPALGSAFRQTVKLIINIPIIEHNGGCRPVFAVKRPAPLYYAIKSALWTEGRRAANVIFAIPTAFILRCGRVRKQFLNRFAKHHAIVASILPIVSPISAKTAR